MDKGRRRISIRQKLRYALTFLEGSKFKVEMPCFIKKGKQHHPTEEAIYSDLMRKLRWVVDSAK